MLCIFTLLMAFITMWTILILCCLVFISLPRLLDFVPGLQKHSPLREFFKICFLVVVLFIFPPLYILDPWRANLALCMRWAFDIIVFRWLPSLRNVCLFHGDLFLGVISVAVKADEITQEYLGK